MESTHRSGSTDRAAARSGSAQSVATRQIRLAVMAIALFSGLVTCGLTSWGLYGMTRREPIPFDGKAALQYLKQLCELGPRPMGSPNMLKQQQLLIKHFKDQGALVTEQDFFARHPLTGQNAAGKNLIVSWHPERLERVMLCTHYDTRPYPDQDRFNRTGVFVGANDGASGTALLMQLGPAIKNLPGDVGVDFVLFDGEELVYRPNDRYFLGSEFFSRQYVTQPPKHRYRCAVLLDMIADKQLELVPDALSWSWPDSRPLIQEIWSTAERLKFKEFRLGRGPEVLDDHIQLHDIAKIPACDLIDFGYPYWHTQEDTPDKCSARSLAVVGYTLQTWLQQAEGPGHTLVAAPTAVGGVAPAE